MKLLLDEMYSFAIAEQLRRRGHDVIAVAERADLRGTADEELFARAQREIAFSSPTTCAITGRSTSATPSRAVAMPVSS